MVLELSHTYPGFQPLSFVPLIKPDSLLGPQGRSKFCFPPVSQKGGKETWGKRIRVVGLFPTQGVASGGWLREMRYRLEDELAQAEEAERPL